MGDTVHYPPQGHKFNREHALDWPSGVFVDHEDEALPGYVLQRELTFRQLEEFCREGIKQWDRLSPRDRLIVQIHNDPHYTPIAFKMSMLTDNALLGPRRRRSGAR